MKEIDLAYMAGLLDGEGCISITKVIPSTNLRNPSYGVSVRVSMVDKNIPVLFHSAFGGSLSQKNYKEYKTQWQWGIYGYPAIVSLKSLLPYLRSKKNEADLAISFWGIKRHRGSNKGQHGNIPKTEKELALEESNYLLMRNLKDKSEVCYG